MKTLLALATSLVSSVVLATPITFNLRDAGIENIDEVNSFSIAQGYLTATVQALPPIFNQPPNRVLQLNRTASAFGVNVDATTCGGLEDSALIDGGCIPESVAVVFNHDVYLHAFTVSSFGSADQALVTIGATTIGVTTTGAHLLGDIFLAAGNPWSIGWVAGNGFSFDNFTALVPAPGTLALLCASLVAGGLTRVKRAARGS